MRPSQGQFFRQEFGKDAARMEVIDRFNAPLSR
jgi:hypothetical protein